MVYLLMGILTTGAKSMESSKFFTTKLNGYVAVAGRASTIFHNAAGYGDARAALLFKGHWAVGLSASGLYYDKKLSALVADGTYHLNLMYGGLYVERQFKLGRNSQLSLSLMTGRGFAQYLYDKEYRPEKVWNEEIIDQTTFGVQELQLNVMQRLSGKWWLGIQAGLRHSAPVELIGTPERLLDNGSAGLSLKYEF